MLKRMELTDEMILSNITGYRERIREAEIKLSELPAATSGWKDGQKLEAQKRALRSEVGHVENLIRIAQEGLTAFNGGGQGINHN
jgi:hypothetical protein